MEDPVSDALLSSFCRNLAAPEITDCASVVSSQFDTIALNYLHGYRCRS